ncbi:BrnT family toxin [uncultured Fibrella sp.]|uniref:BrnT family toxin n=1 Tax=uncultured Fibrella sp. TaxID=1284596 RepID=UPI0035C9B20A
MLEFQWDAANKGHIIDQYPLRANTVEEVESIFIDPNFRPAPDRVDSRGEQQYSGVGLSNQNRLLFVAFSYRNGQIRPISCRPAGRKDRNKYAQTTQKSEQESDSENDSRD